MIFTEILIMQEFLLYSILKRVPKAPSNFF